jgi:hypothetical protein
MSNTVRDLVTIRRMSIEALFDKLGTVGGGSHAMCHLPPHLKSNTIITLIPLLCLSAKNNHDIIKLIGIHNTILQRMVINWKLGCHLIERLDQG